MAGSKLKKQLPASEAIIFEAVRHWVRYIKPILAAVASLFTLLILIVAREQLPSSITASISEIRLALFAVFFGSTIFGLLMRYRDRFFEMVVTNDNIISKSGMGRQKTRSLSLDHVEFVNVEQSLLGRMLGFGDISIISQGSSFANFSAVSHPIGFRNAVISERDRKKRPDGIS